MTREREASERLRPTRRDVLRGAAAAGAALGLPRVVHAEPEPVLDRAMPTRPFGKTGAKVSVFGLGCHPLGTLSSEDAAVAVIVKALDLGCTYIDTAPSYSRGQSERRVGLALAARPDCDAMLATKTHTRTADDARRDLEQSLERLKVDRIDLVQVHAVGDEADMRRALDTKRGPLAALLKARDEKLVRWIGVTGHRDPGVMARTFAEYAFDSVLMPLNCVDPHYQVGAGDDRRTLSFVEETLPLAVKNGLARVAMKVFSSGRLVTGGVEARACLRYAYGLDISTAVVGCKSVTEVELAAQVAREAERLTAAETKSLLARTASLKGRDTEWYKRP